MNWDLTKLCKDDSEFESALEELKELTNKAASFQGKLDNEENFKAFMLLQKEFELKISKPYMYASMGSDLDKRNVANAAKDAKVMNLFNQYTLATSYADPEIISIGKEKVMTWLNNNKELEEFKFPLENLFRKAEHTLDKDQEKIIASYSPVASKGGDLYSTLSVADNKPNTIKIDGKPVTVTQGNWRSLIADSKSAKERKKIFEAIYKYYDDHKNTYASIYESILQGNKAYANSKKFGSILESYLYTNNIPTSVYTNLLDVASKHTKALKKYYKLRKEYLGLKHHYSYDRFLELAKSNKKYTYEEAKALYFKAIEGCPEDFIKKAHMTLEEGYVDVMEKDGKRSGAYSSSMPNVHPFILLNFDGTLDSVFTIAHESGHSIHSLYSEESQPSTLQGYTIFVAEIASTFNEHMLLDYLLKSDDLSNDDKIMLLQKEIDDICSTFYRQTLFGHYEYEASKLIEQDQPINYEVLSEIMTKLYKQYYGLDLNKEPLKKLVWCYIPHMFYTPFYVYQYATSFAASFKIFKNVKEKGIEGFNQYLGLLKAGGSKYPVLEAKEAGVDFTKKDAFMAVVDRMTELVDQLEVLLKQTR